MRNRVASRVGLVAVRIGLSRPDGEIGGIKQHRSENYSDRRVETFSAR